MLRIIAVKLCFLITIFFSGLVIIAQQDSTNNEPPVFLSKPTPWADSLIKTLTPEQKIGQLFMVAAWSDPRHQSYDVSGMDLLIKKFGIGGIIFFQGSPVRQALLTNRFQKESAVPLMIGMDAEWGLGMRLDSTISFPRQMSLGAIRDESVIYDFGREIARQMKRLGVQVSFSPVVDINNNPKNPVISNRAFGEDRDLVTRYSYQYMKGLQDGGVLANAKHFPGHGDTDTDSHKDLPVIPYDLNRLDSLELYPYTKLFQSGLSSVMIAHLYVPALDSTPNLPSTLSKNIVTSLLKEKLGFEGLVFTDALNMQGVTKYFKPGVVELKSLLAGNDVLLYSQTVAKAVQTILAAVDSGFISQEEIDAKCLKILRAKEWAGLHNMEPVKIENLVEDLNTPAAQALQRRLIEKSITILRNNCDLGPLCHSDSSRVAVVSIGSGASTVFSRTIAKYARFDAFAMDKNPDLKTSMFLHDTLSTYDLVIGAMLNTSNKASKNFGVSNEAARIFNSIGEKTNVVLSVFANPYSFSTLREMDNIKDIIISFQDDSLTQQVTAEIIAGACTADGRLPVSASQRFSYGEGITVGQQTRLRWVTPAYLGICSGYSKIFSGKELYSKPKESHPGNVRGGYREDMMADVKNTSAGITDNCFYPIDSIAMSGILKGAYPGCRVLVAKDGFVVYDKSFGFLDWDRKNAVNTQTVYDLASVTKLASTTLAAMLMVDEGKIDVNKTLGDYLDIPQNNAYSGIVLKNMLAHCAGLTPWIPFYQSTIEDGKLSSRIYRNTPETGFTKQVAEGVYIMNSYSDTIFHEILNTPLAKDKSYKYSDLAFYFMQRIIEKVSGESLDTLVRKSFYAPMSLESMGYNPLLRMDKERIAPTENDKVWRKQHLRGYVHDQGAAMLGGVGGHAGLFSTAKDLAAIMQMLMNGGTYGGRRYLNTSTIDLFNSCYFPGNRRGLGFDKPADTKGTGSTCPEATESSFGHTGFTGTMCWADPQTGIVFIFLSNRVNPDAENKKIQTLDIRTNIQHEAYKILGFTAQ
ncbi:MAG: serine hydrolase [Crocinitomicaceae bacterium]|nr:serine hydrolase [Crocinitomicaceae bacterium]